jgi:hypothetical protein
VQSSGPSGDRSPQAALRALDDVAKRGQEARDTVGRRGPDERRVSALEHRLTDDPKADPEPQVEGK